MRYVFTRAACRRGGRIGGRIAGCTRRNRTRRAAIRAALNAALEARGGLGRPEILGLVDILAGLYRRAYRAGQDAEHKRRRRASAHG
jgi:hypothetical protein